MVADSYATERRGQRERDSEESKENIGLTWLLSWGDSENGCHVADGELRPAVLHDATDTLEGLDDRGLLVGLDIDLSLALGCDGASNAEGATLPGERGRLVHDLIDELSFLSGGAGQHEQARVRHRRDEGLLRDSAVVLGPADSTSAPSSHIQDGPIDSTALHPVPGLNVLRDLCHVGVA